MTMKRFVFVLSLCAASFVYGVAPSWPEATRDAKPWVYNWCMGSAMDEAGLEFQSRELAEKGFGGFHVIPIYGAKGYEKKWKKYLSPEWMEMFALAKRIGEKHGLGIDLTSGTGWCFGGPWLKKEEGSWKLEFDKEGRLVPTLTGQRVKRAAPGGEGPMMNPFSPGAMDSFLKKFEVFDKPGAVMPEHFYHDSYEYFNAAWSPELPAAFKRRRGYDLMEKWDVFSGKGDPKEVARVKCDYRQTLDDLMVEEVFPKWVEWCHRRGVKTRNEAHGSPANWLDLYALADVPETEMFGRDRDILISKFASSAAHVTRKRYVSAETCTWIAEHFNETLAEAKVFIDRLFLSGVNRVFFQGCAYSPVDAPWPGWCFYASMQMNPRNPIWRDVGTLTTYITRCQSIFQSCEPDNDVLVYWPLRDYWWDAKGYEKMMSVHTGEGWFYKQPIGPFAKKLYKEGYSFDFVSDRMLQNAKSLGLKSRYAALAVPECRHMPERTKESILSLGFADVSKARREPFAASGLMFTRFRKGGDTVYFLANQTDGGISGAFAPSCRPKSAWLMNPMTGAISAIAVQDGKVRIGLEPGHSCFLWCSPDKTQGEIEKSDGETTWLDLGEVIGNESVRVTVNGKFLGTLIMPPYRVEVPHGVLKRTKVEDNDIVVDVCERAANRIREMDLKGVKWKNFSDINMVDINYRPLDASKWPVMPHGVKGPIRIYRGPLPEPLPAAARPMARPAAAQHPRWAGAGFWDRRHKAKLAEIAAGPKEYDCVFVGDSITHNWEGWSEKPDVEVAERLYANGGLKFPNGPGRAVWEEMKRSWRVLNLGMAGDTTQNVLWRLDHGEMDGYRTRYVFVMIGTNNGDSPENRAKGIKAVLDKVAERQPQATILLSPIFPSGAKPNDSLRVSKDKTNAIIKGYADGKRIVWVDFNSKFLNSDGTLNTALMPDFLHPLEAGYRIWYDAINSTLADSPTAAARLRDNLLAIGRGKTFVYAASTGANDWKPENVGSFRAKAGVSPLLYFVEFRDIVGTWHKPEYYAVNKTNLAAFVKREYAEHRAVPMVTWHLNNPYMPPKWRNPKLDANAAFRYRYGMEGYPEEHRWVLREIVEGTGGPCGDGRIDGQGERTFANPRAWYEWCLKDAAAFCRTLKDEKGNQIPIVFRPFHECESDWFWWGSKSATCDDYIAAFRLTVDILRRELGAGNVLFAYSPDRFWHEVGEEGKSGFLARYPGDAYCDMIGFDDYELGKDHDSPMSPKSAAKTTAAVIRRARIVSQIGRDRDKICGIFESGVKDSVDSFYSEMRKVMTAPGVEFAIATTYDGSWTWPKTEAGLGDMKEFFMSPEVVVDRRTDESVY